MAYPTTISIDSKLFYCLSELRKIKLCFQID